MGRSHSSSLSSLAEIAGSKNSSPKLLSQVSTTEVTAAPLVAPASNLPVQKVDMLVRAAAQHEQITNHSSF